MPDIVQVGVDHHGASLAVLEHLRGLVNATVRGAVRARCGGVVALVTCHRCELFLEGVPAAGCETLFATWLGVPPGALADIAPFVRVRCGESAARHLLRVAAGLESAVLGEDQVLGQVREAYRTACLAAEAGPLLHRLFHAAFRAGRRVRSETELGHGARSLSGAGVAWLGRAMGGFGGRTVLIAGAGEMAADVARRLRRRGVKRLLIVNRTSSRAQALAEEAGGEARPWDWRQGALCEADGAVCAVSAPRPVVSAEALAVWVRHHGAPVAVVDLGVPRNVEAALPLPAGLRLADLASLATELETVGERRACALKAAEAIVEEELRDWLCWAWTRRAGCGGEARHHAHLAG